MSRVTLHTLETAPSAAKPFLENAQKNSGFIPNLLGILANAPAALETYVTVSGLNGKAELTLPEREVVQLIAATRHGCDFCVAGHTAVAQNKAKLPDEVVSALRGQTQLPVERLESWRLLPAKSSPSAAMSVIRPMPRFRLQGTPKVRHWK